MSGIPVGDPEGLHQQIDDLDALLDRLLKLPLGPAPIPERPLPTLKIADPDDSLLEVMDEALELDPPILRLESAAERESTPATGADLKLAPFTSEYGTLPIVGAIHADREEPSAVYAVETRQEQVSRLAPEEIPWLEDEPARCPRPPIAHPELAQEPLPPLTGAAPLGPRVEIVQGSLNTTLLRADGIHAGPSVEDETRSGLLRWACWRVTRLFDATIGALMPGLRRKAGRNAMGLLGWALLIASAVLAWKWWRQ